MLWLLACTNGSSPQLAWLVNGGGKEGGTNMNLSSRDPTTSSPNLGVITSIVTFSYYAYTLFKYTCAYLQYLEGSRNSTSCGLSFLKLRESLHLHSRSLDKTHYASREQPASSHASLHTLFRPLIVESACLPAPVAPKNERTSPTYGTCFTEKVSLPAWTATNGTMIPRVLDHQATPTHVQHNLIIDSVQ